MARLRQWWVLNFGATRGRSGRFPLWLQLGAMAAAALVALAVVGFEMLRLLQARGK